MRWLYDPRTSWLILGATTLLLGTLATLQYHWLGEVSRAEAERLRAGLDSALERFALDFDRELARVAVHFLGNRAFSAADDAGELPADGERVAARLREWRQTAPYPELILDVLRWDRGDDRWDLQCLDESAARFERCAVPELESLESRFGAPEPIRGRLGPPSWPQLLLPEVPATIIPRFNFSTPASRPSVSGWLLIRFNLDFLGGTLTPELGARHLAWGGELEFEYGVFSRDDVETYVPVHRSDPRLPVQHYLEGDRRIELFRPLPREILRDLLFERGLPVPGFSGRPRGRSGDRGPRAFERSARPVAGPGWGFDGRSSSRSWVLAVRHPEGSLDIAVRRARYRNLVVSSGVLLLLGLTMAMLLVAVRRTRELSAHRVELVAGITHELRTPLAAIRSLAQNLADGIVDQPEKARRYGQMIEGQGARLSALVEQSLELSGILAGGRSYAFEAVAVTDAVTAAMSDCRPLLEDGGELESRFAEDLPAVQADPVALRKAVGNLIANAIKYGGEDGWVGIEIFRSSLGKNSEVAVRISDHGPGIPRDEQSRLFDAFYRGRDAAEAQVPGSGLGLSLVKHIVDAHGGRVDVRSEPGQGSAFTIFLPALEKSDVDARDPAD